MSLFKKKAKPAEEPEPAGPDEVTNYSATQQDDQFLEEITFGSGKVVRLDTEDDPEDHMTEAELASYTAEREQSAKMFAEDEDMSDLAWFMWRQDDERRERRERKGAPGAGPSGGVAG